MKKIVLLFVVCLGATQLFSQTLFTYGPYAVSKDEFLRAYNKNKTPVTDIAQSLKEYLELYARFKLKVKTAQVQKLDTLQQLKYDLQNFRSQVAEGYMNDEKGLNALVGEAIQRSQKDIHLLHFYVGINSKMSTADTLKAYKALNEMAGELKESETGYSEIAEKISGKYMEVKGEDLGYITVLSLPYGIENLVYNLKPGAITKLYRTKSALHLFKNEDERKSAGKWKIAQILLSIPPNVSGPELKAIEIKADSIYKLLIAGADFALLAKQFSEDKLTYMNGGEMPEFGTGKFELPFETKVFELKNHVQWLFVDMNLPPEGALREIEKVVEKVKPSLKGAFITLKMTKFELVSRVPMYLTFVSNMGLSVVMATQLSSHKQEFLIYAENNN